MKTTGRASMSLKYDSDGFNAEVGVYFAKVHFIAPFSAYDIYSR
jgi:hypothetical protein